ncbi:MAG: hypothetical protein ACTFAL_03025 [Candidatus Electronema sp. V4]|uniref:hypothetical protein n=1 Tax=Candidatus Electronema sp. V4 TaxID=3454756 RepID=UPI0040556C58
MGVIDMAGRFEGLSAAEWKLLEGIFPEKEGRSGGGSNPLIRHFLNIDRFQNNNDLYTCR